MGQYVHVLLENRNKFQVSELKLPDCTTFVNDPIFVLMKDTMSKND